MTKTLLSAAFALAFLGSTALANAEPRHHDMGGGPHFRGGEFHRNDFRGDFRGPTTNGPRMSGPAFRGDRDSWRGGNWRHERHNGRLGWWWVVGDFWSFYPEPIYPYPAYYDDDDDYASPAVVGGTWYYCAHPQGYYPYVRRCDTRWEAVPAQPD